MLTAGHRPIARLIAPRRGQRPIVEAPFARRRLALVAATTLLALSTTTGCGRIGDLRFTQDHRLDIVSPANLATVSLPVTVRWRVKDFTPEPPGRPVRADTGHFAVFVDRYPVPPGASLKEVVGQPSCEADPRCPSSDLLALQYNVYVTDRTEVRLPSVPAGALNSDAHYATVVLIDGSGHRIGDSFWNVSFSVSASGSGS
ncbi:hypothetical protein ACFT9I_16600 [Streptomyces sp. NPDC057137]|uniref:hypothetical protein n=1 Tax=Streptomyces sp. NPDC057137 TaxID=3346030 RepID=UPI00363DA998